MIAILDTGIRWQDRELVEQVHLNAAELPQPLADRADPVGGGPACDTFAAADDANGTAPSTSATSPATPASIPPPATRSRTTSSTAPT